MYAVLHSLSEVIVNEMQAGKEVILDGIGRLFLSLKSRNSDSREEFSSKNITNAIVRLAPALELDVYDGMEFDFVPTRKQQEIAKAASKAGQTLEASDGDTD